MTLYICVCDLGGLGCSVPTIPQLSLVQITSTGFMSFQARVQFQNEYGILCQLPSHENIIHMYAFFFDRANPDVSEEFRKVGRNVRTMSLFLLMDEHPMSMKEQLDILTKGQGPKVRENSYRGREGGMEGMYKHI